MPTTFYVLWALVALSFMISLGGLRMLFYNSDVNILLIAAISVWVIAPIPLAACLGVRFVGPGGAWLLIAGILIANTATLWVYWDAFWGPSSRAESLAGLVVLFFPVYQVPWLAMALVLARWKGR